MPIQKDSLNELQLEVQKLCGKIDVFDVKLGEVAKSSELVNLKMDLKEHIGKQIKLHEKEKHSILGNNEIKIALPMKLAAEDFLLVEAEL